MSDDVYEGNAVRTVALTVAAVHVQIPRSNRLVAVNHPCQRCGQVLQSNIMCTVQLHGVTPTGHWHFDCTPATIIRSPANVILEFAHLSGADRVRVSTSILGSRVCMV